MATARKITFPTVLKRALPGARDLDYVDDARRHAIVLAKKQKQRPTVDHFPSIFVREDACAVFHATLMAHGERRYKKTFHHYTPKSKTAVITLATRRPARNELWAQRMLSSGQSGGLKRGRDDEPKDGRKMCRPDGLTQLHLPSNTSEPAVLVGVAATFRGERVAMAVDEKIKLSPNDPLVDDTLAALQLLVQCKLDLRVMSAAAAAATAPSPAPVPAPAPAAHA